MGFYGFWWVLVQIRWADDRGGRSGGKSVIVHIFSLKLPRCFGGVDAKPPNFVASQLFYGVDATHYGRYERQRNVVNANFITTEDSFLEGLVTAIYPLLG